MKKQPPRERSLLQKIRSAATLDRWWLAVVFGTPSVAAMILAGFIISSSLPVRLTDADRAMLRQYDSIRVALSQENLAFAQKAAATLAGSYQKRRPISAAAQALSKADTDESGTLMEPVKSVLDHYLKIQSALTNDSIDGVASNASAIGSAVRGDSMKMLSPEVADQADALAKAKDVAVAREAFKPLSKSLIQYLNDHNVTGAYVEVYCPMAKASWVQKGEKIDNPYLGASMRGCGEIQKKPKQKSS
jgi:Cu(I)/Ag(I) efflux system membrane fusion protein